jgi:hypothetical protein
MASADGVQIVGSGALEAAAKAEARAARMRDLTNPNRVIALEIEARVLQGFTRSQSQRGVPFEPLAPASIQARLRGQSRANKRTASGKLTKGSMAFRVKLSAPGGLRPLIWSGRAKGSQHTFVGPQTIRWSAVWYLFFHMVGGKNLPQRNPTPFEYTGSGWRLEPTMQSFAVRTYRTHILQGRA